MMTKEDIEKLREADIIAVAEALGINVRRKVAITQSIITESIITESFITQSACPPFSFPQGESREHLQPAHPQAAAAR